MECAQFQPAISVSVDTIGMFVELGPGARFAEYFTTKYLIFIRMKQVLVEKYSSFVCRMCLVTIIHFLKYM